MRRHFRIFKGDNQAKLDYNIYTMQNLCTYELFQQHKPCSTSFCNLSNLSATAPLRTYSIFLKLSPNHILSPEQLRSHTACEVYIEKSPRPHLCCNGVKFKYADLDLFQKLTDLLKPSMP